MAYLYNKISSVCPSRLVNAWRVKMRSGTYVVTPAHVALHVKDGKYTRSSFLSDMDGLTWYVPRLYSGADYSFSFDCAWARVPDDAEAQDTYSGDVTHSMASEIFFRQPYDECAKWDAQNSVLGSVKAQVYPSPKSQLLEALDIGFKEISGALVTTVAEGQSKALGILLRRGLPISLKKKKTPARQVIHHDDVYADTSQNLATMSAGESQIISMMKRLDSRLDSLERRFDSRFDSLERRFDSLENRVLTSDDLDRLLNVTAMRRSMVMPCKRIEHLMQDAVMLSELEDKFIV